MVWASNEALRNWLGSGRLPNSLDEEWQIDVRKANAHPPGPVRETRRIARKTPGSRRGIYAIGAKPSPGAGLWKPPSFGTANSGTDGSAIASIGNIPSSRGSWTRPTSRALDAKKR